MLPRFSVFHNPPDADATYHTFGFFGSMSTSDTRPVVMSGPILRSGNALKVSCVIPESDCAPSPAHAARTMRARVRVRFMEEDYKRPWAASPRSCGADH